MKTLVFAIFFFVSSMAIAGPGQPRKLVTKTTTTTTTTTTEGAESTTQNGDIACQPKVAPPEACFLAIEKAKSADSEFSTMDSAQTAGAVPDFSQSSGSIMQKASWGKNLMYNRVGVEQQRVNLYVKTINYLNETCNAESTAKRNEAEICTWDSKKEAQLASQAEASNNAPEALVHTEKSLVYKGAAGVYSGQAVEIETQKEQAVAYYSGKGKLAAGQAGINFDGALQMGATEAAVSSSAANGAAAAGSGGAKEGKMGEMSTGAKVGLGVAAAGGAYMLYDNKKDKDDKKKDKKREEARERDEANGIITSDSGERLECKRSKNVSREECGEFLTKHCAAESGAPTVGCMGFQAHKCSMNATTQFCVLMASKKHCAQSGSMIGQSPACQWVSARPSSCNKNLEDVNCLSSHSTDALNLSCPDFPADPLCKAHYNGAVVSIPNMTPSQPVAEVPAGQNRPEQDGVILESQLPGSAQDTMIANSNLLQQLCLDGSLYSCEPARTPSSGQ